MTKVPAIGAALWESLMQRTLSQKPRPAPNFLRKLGAGLGFWLKVRCIKDFAIFAAALYKVPAIGAAPKAAKATTL